MAVVKKNDKETVVIDTRLVRGRFGKIVEEKYEIKIEDEQLEKKEDISDFYKPVKEAVVKAIENIEKEYKTIDSLEKSFLITGIKNFNLHNGDFIVLGARPSIGKTAFALSLLSHLSVEQKIPTGYITCGDTDFGRIGQRLISIKSGVAYQKIRCGMLNMDDVREIQNAASQIYESPLFIHDVPNIMFAELEFTARMMVQKQNAKLIVIDSFEYLQAIVDAKEDEYRYDLEDLLNEFKKMAKELKVPVVLLMNMPLSEDGIEPNLGDFSKYMIIPRLADSVMFLHRERCKSADEIPDCKLIIAKSEKGFCHDINIRFSPQTAGFIFDKTVMQ